MGKPLDQSRALLALGLLTTLPATACGSRGAPVATAHDTDRAQPADDGAKPGPNAAPAAKQQPLAQRPLHTQAESALAGSAALGVSRFTLQLPRDASFVDSPLPAADPERYRAWAQLARVWVGKSHLQYATFLDGERLILAHSDAETGVRVYQRDSRKLLANHDLSFKPFTSPGAVILPWSASSTWFLLGNENGLQLYDALSGAPVSALNAHPVNAMRWSPDGNVLVVCTTPAPNQRSQLTFYRKLSAKQPHDVVQLQELGVMPLFGRVEGWDLSRDNRLLAVSLYPQEALMVFDLQSGEVIANIAAQKYASDVSISADGRWLAVGGQGLLLVDLANPARRAFYSYYHNNIASVRFSPSSDALVTSSFDGRIRIFGYDGEGPTLRLVKTLSHDGQANVYTIQFAEDGNSLLSASGDQTLRLFGAKPNAQNTGRTPGRFRTLVDWRAHLPAAQLSTAPLPQLSLKDGHYHPPQLDAPPRPSRIHPGVYACRIATMYKLRECTVSKTPSGHTLLEFHSDNLLCLNGVLYDDGPVVRYEAWLTQPSTIVGCDGCQRQPLHGLLRGAGGRYKGLLTFRNYADPLLPTPLPDANATFEDADDRFALVLNYKGPLPSPPPQPPLPRVGSAD